MYTPTNTWKNKVGSPSIPGILAEMDELCCDGKVAASPSLKQSDVTVITAELMLLWITAAAGEFAGASNHGPNPLWPFFTASVTL